MANFILQGNPCRRDCPDRQPGCNCQKRQEWVAEKNARKKMIYEEKAKEGLVDSYMNSPRPRKARAK